MICVVISAGRTDGLKRFLSELDGPLRGLFATTHRDTSLFLSDGRDKVRGALAAAGHSQEVIDGLMSQLSTFVDVE